MKQIDADSLKQATDNIVIVPLTETHMEFYTKIAEHAMGRRHIDLTEVMDPHKFSGGEFVPWFRYGEGVDSLEGKNVYAIGASSPFISPQEIVMRGIMTARSAKENGAVSYTLVLPDLPHTRQDRGPDEDEKTRGQLNTARLWADLFAQAGVDQVLTTHLHSERVYKYYADAYNVADGREVLKNISLESVLADYILYSSSLKGTEYLANEGENLVFIATDKGNKPFIDALHSATFLKNASVIYCNKARKVPNKPDAVTCSIAATSDNFTTLDNKVIVLADDIMDTGGTMIKTLRWAFIHHQDLDHGLGKPKECFLYFTHPVLAGDAHKNIQRKLIKDVPYAREIVTTNSWPNIGDSQHHMFKVKSTVLRLAKFWGDAIIAHYRGVDVTSRYTQFGSADGQHAFLHQYGKGVPLYSLKRHSRHFLSEPEHASRKVILFEK